MAYWWLNQTGSYEPQRDGRYIWAPATTNSGGKNAYFEHLPVMGTGDLVIHTDGKAIRAVSGVAEHAKATPRPTGLERPWGAIDGRLVKVGAYAELADPIPLRDIPREWRLAEPREGPFTKQGTLKSGYLSPLSSEFMRRLRERYPGRWPDRAHTR